MYVNFVVIQRVHRDARLRIYATVMSYSILNAANFFLRIIQLVIYLFNGLKENNFLFYFLHL